MGSPGVNSERNLAISTWAAVPAPPPPFFLPPFGLFFPFHPPLTNATGRTSGYIPSLGRTSNVMPDGSPSSEGMAIDTTVVPPAGSLVTEQSSGGKMASNASISSEATSFLWSASPPSLASVVVVSWSSSDAPAALHATSHRTSRTSRRTTPFLVESPSDATLSNAFASLGDTPYSSTKPASSAVSAGFFAAAVAEAIPPLDWPAFFAPLALANFPPDTTSSVLPRGSNPMGRSSSSRWTHSHWRHSSYALSN
mmetsp:Transcript_20173/g.58343  ORF Transcript_20173/g.58343 Transcript_20173/m.58343 type:complete len:253 (+) Transcript_20173:982-1740(+)